MREGCVKTRKGVDDRGSYSAPNIGPRWKISDSGFSDELRKSENFSATDSDRDDSAFPDLPPRIPRSHRQSLEHGDLLHGSASPYLLPIPILSAGTACRLPQSSLEVSSMRHALLLSAVLLLPMPGLVQTTQWTASGNAGLLQWANISCNQSFARLPWFGMVRVGHLALRGLITSTFHSFTTLLRTSSSLVGPSSSSATLESPATVMSRDHSIE
jgi:hypothetical protein